MVLRKVFIMRVIHLNDDVLRGDILMGSRYPQCETCANRDQLPYCDTCISGNRYELDRIKIGLLIHQGFQKGLECPADIPITTNFFGIADFVIIDKKGRCIIR